MKKIILIAIAVFLLVPFAAVSAKAPELDGALSPLNFGSVISWKNTIKEIAAFLEDIDGLECNAEKTDEGYYIDCKAVITPEETDYYYFFFDKKQMLYQADSEIILGDSIDPGAVMNQFISAYQLDRMQKYTDDAVKETCGTYDKCASVADKKQTTNVIIAYNKASAQSKAVAYISFYNLNH